MKKSFRVVISLMLAVMMAFSLMCTAASADDDAATDVYAYFMFADSSWANQYWGSDVPDGMTVTTAAVTGSGEYTVAVEVEAGFDGLAFAAIGINNGEIAYPGATIELTSLKINGEEVEFAKGYTSSDDGITTRMNIYNEWVSSLPDDARSYDGDISESMPVIIGNDVTGVTSIEATFNYAVPTAYLMFADTAWANQYWGSAEEGSAVVASDVAVTGLGEYTVSVQVPDGFDGLAFAAVGISNGELAFPGATIELLSVKVNGEEVEFGKGYTSSDDGITTRMNLYNEWVSGLPDDARSYDGDLTDCSPTIISNDLAGVTDLEVSFSYHVPTAYIMFADSSWTNQYWCSPAEGVTAVNKVVSGEGTYTVSVTTAEPFDGLAFAAIGMKDCEKAFPGWCIELTSLKINGEEVETGKGYTSSDDGSETRMNLYNEWVSALPSDARSYDDDLSEASPTIIDNAVTGVTSIEATFTFAPGSGTPVEEEPEDTFDYEAALLGTYNAYMAVQTSPGYTFRNEWFEASYGKNADGDYFSHLTGWDADNNALDCGGVFTDTVISGDGTYTVALDLAADDLGFADQEGYNFLYVVTDIPYQLIKNGYVEISDVKTSFDGGGAKSFTYVTKTTDASTGTDYAEIQILSAYNSDVGEEAIPFIMPESNITVTFTVSGFGGEAAAVEEAPAEAVTEAPVEVVSEAPAAAQSSSASWIIWVVVAVVVIAVVVVVLKKKGKKD